MKKLMMILLLSVLLLLNSCSYEVIEEKPVTVGKAYNTFSMKELGG